MTLIKGIFFSLVFAIVAFFIYQNLMNTDEVVSPIPQNSGVKVIQVSPSK